MELFEELEASPRLASFYREHGIVAAIDMRGSELELIAPEICMESIWIEPHRRQADDMPCKMPATIAFFTTDLIGQNFVCFYSSEWEILKCVRIISHDDGSFTAIRGFTTIKCISATNIKGRRLMAVVEKDHSTVLYTGVCRLGTLYVQHTPIEHSLFSSTPAQLWEYMLSRESADTGYAQTETKRRRQYSVDISEEAELHSHARFMLSGLHASYEHAKMDTRLAFLTPMMASALHALSTIFALPAYVKYYREDFADLVNDAFEFRSDAAKGDLSSMRRLSERVPSLHGSVLRVLEERCLVGSLSCPTKCLPIVVLIAIGLGKIRNTFELQRAVGKNWEKKLGLSELDASFLFDTLDSIRGSPGDKCRSCARLFNVSEHFLMNLPPSVALLVCEILYDDRLLALNFFCPVPVVKPYRMLPSEEEIYRTVRFRWKYDMRFTNAMQMLDSSHPIFIPANNGVSEMEQRDMQEQMLTVVNMRTLTQCFGRAAIEFRHLVPPMNMPLSVPELCLQGRLHPCNMPFEMQHTEASKVMIEWGAFYNGVAAGLRVGSERSCNLDGEWLALSVSEQKGSASAGMIYAFGLNGHMAKINLFTIHELLSAGDRLMSASVLLGYAANMLATGDRQIYKVLVTHLPFMMGPTLLELHIDPMVQTAALVGLGLLFAKSSHLGILSLLLNEIGKPAPLDQEPWTDRYSYTLAVGFAVGLISLGQGEQLSADIPFMERYPSLQSRLLLMMEGGPRSLCVFPTNAPTDILPPGTTDSVNANVPQMSNHVMEFDNVNPHLSRNETVAKRMRAPTTLSKLEKIRPDLLLLRTLCQSLIMWNQIEPSEMYVEELVPSVLRQYVSRFFEDELILVDEDASYLSTIVDLETIARSYLNIVAGACFAIAIRYASSFCRGAFETIVMAGSGDLEVLRLCRVLRRRVVASNAQKDVALYSTQVAANTAIGLIMIGKGRYALATNDLSVAALVIAFFPVAPHSISDNRTYLQPLRFLWSLSAEERLIDVVDAQTEEPLAKAAVNILFKARFWPLPVHFKVVGTVRFARLLRTENTAAFLPLVSLCQLSLRVFLILVMGNNGVRCEEKRSGDSNKGSDVVDSDLKNLSDAEFDEMEMENECRTTIAEMGESSNSSSSTHTLQQIEFEEQRKSDWTPSYADDDIIEKDDTRFPRVQCREVTAFLERCERKGYEPTAIASHLAASVSCLP
ncbi:unnamed protein product [Toxocara canis]|uniref:Anaphase-promoting complex subunit 1 n=1 Tax=Toxocara canis TaxID=6265 RepID=A0A183UEV4_TOXCA|nr:unnamed protein product [Toxocara canis]